jgi:hypothetical protein
MLDEGYFRGLERLSEPGQKLLKSLRENYDQQMKELEKSRKEWEEENAKQLEENRTKFDQELKQGFRTTYRNWPLQRI